MMKHLLAIGTALLLTGDPALHGRDWIYGQEDYIEVLSRAPAHPAREFYRELFLFPEVVRTVFDNLPAIEPAPTLLVVVDNAHSLRSFLPDSYRQVTVTSFFEETPHLDLMVVLEERYQTTDPIYDWMFRDYGRKLLRPFSLPLWFQAGMGELLGNIEIRRNFARLGFISSGQLQPVRQNGVLPIEQFFAFYPDFSPDEYQRESHYFSQATLLAHYFLFSTAKDNRDAFLAYLLTAEALLGGESEFQDAVGLSFKELEQILIRYSRRERFSVHRYNLRGVKQPPAIALEVIAPIRERALIARAEVAAGQLDRAYLNLAHHLSLGEPVPELYRSAHFLFLARQDLDSARAMAERAIALGEQSPDLLRSAGVEDASAFEEVPTHLLEE